MRAQGEDRLQCRKGHGAGTRVLGQRIRIIYIGSANHVRITNFVLRRSYAQLRLSLASFLSSKRSTPALRAKCMGGAHRSIHVACKWDASCVVPKRNLNAQHTPQHTTSLEARPPHRGAPRSLWRRSHISSSNYICNFFLRHTSCVLTP